MARSIGEAAALGLDAGYRMATDADERAKRQERQTMLDKQHVEQQAYVRGRQVHADRLSAIGLQGKVLQEEGLALQGSTDPAAQAAFADKTDRYRKARDAELAGASGLNLDPVTKLGQEDLVRLQNGDVQGANVSRAVAISTGRPHTDYQRSEGQLSVVEQAADDMLKGMESGDQKTLLKGVNTMYAPELRNGVGSKSPHGGVIVGKEIIGLDPAPGSDPQDPHYVPRIRVYVKGDKPLRGPQVPGRPKDATSYYDAPLTRNRSSDPNDMVRAIGLNEAMDWLHKQQEVVEALNTPEAQQKLAEEAQRGDFDVAAHFDKAMRMMGVTGGAKSVKDEMVKPTDGQPAYKVRQDYDAKGNPVGAPKRVDIEGNEGHAGKPKPKGDVALTNAAIDQMVEDGEMTPEEGRAAKRKNVIKKTENAPRKAGGGGGGSGGGNEKIHKTEKDSEGYLLGVFKDGSTRRLLVNGKPVKSQDFEKRVDKIAHDMGATLDGIGKNQTQLRTEAREAALQGVSAEEKAPAKSDAPAKPRIKFDKDGKRIP